MTAIYDQSDFQAPAVNAANAANAVIDSPWYDTTLFNWGAAVTIADVAHTLLMLESKDGLANNSSAMQVGAASAAVAQPAGSPQVGKFVARLVPAKALLRFVKFRATIGAAPTTSFDFQIVFSPLN
jgi:hypothetical protein